MVDSIITQVRPPGEEEEESSDEVVYTGFFCCFWPKKNKGRNKSKQPTPNKGLGALDLSQISRQANINSPRGDHGIPIVPSPVNDDLLPPQRENKRGFKCLVLDLDETLVHSSFQEVPNYDFRIPVEIEDVTYTVFVAKRPGVDEFMKRMGACYEIVVFTASVAKYADPVLDLLDVHKVVDWRLFRESCTFVRNMYVKDMGRMGRPITSVLIIDNSPHSYAFNPENAIPCMSWFEDQADRELLEFIPILESVARNEVDNVITELERLKMNGYSRLVESGVPEETDSHATHSQSNITESVTSSYTENSSKESAEG
eukprot:TRINITY_DN3098_c0_g1_i15.p1 TRINITY_DN3098_c0_g1~~TRINITY_DN3098_c0_g1_i15.p1  ORF type:complete len:314 (+),score=67.20 TRINITY_DN3098_c0_g1_i15:36-977(+)